MKTYEYIRLFLLACTCVTSCKVKIRVPNFKQLQNAVASTTKGLMSVMMETLSTRQFETKEDLNTHHETTGNNIKVIDEKVEETKEAISSDFLPKISSLIESVRIVVEKSHAGLDIWILILLLVAILGLRYLRLRTENDLFSNFGYHVLMGFMELALLFYALYTLASIFYHHAYVEYIEKQVSLQLAVVVTLGFIVLITAFHCRSVINIRNKYGNRNFNFTHNRKIVAQATD